MTRSIKKSIITGTFFVTRIVKKKKWILSFLLRTWLFFFAEHKRRYFEKLSYGTSEFHCMD